MSYRVKEIFHTLQGEGMRAGRAAVFCRFCGCNLWSGWEEDRSTAICSFCDTDFIGADAGVFDDAAELAAAIARTFPPTADLPAQPKQPTQPGPAECGQRRGRICRPYVVLTGGEPSLQITPELVDALHGRGFEIGVESNGTRPLPPGIDWVTVSPKAGAPLAVTAGNELKLVWPQTGCSPEDFADLDFVHFILQPRDDAPRGRSDAAGTNARLCIDYCLTHPQWRLGVQTHKWLGVR